MHYIGRKLVSLFLKLGRYFGVTSVTSFKIVQKNSTLSSQTIGSLDDTEL
jgi:hypothetical protein